MEIPTELLIAALGLLPIAGGFVFREFRKKDKETKLWILKWEREVSARIDLVMKPPPPQVPESLPPPTWDEDTATRIDRNKLEAEAIRHRRAREHEAARLRRLTQDWDPNVPTGDTPTQIRAKQHSRPR